MKKSPKDLPYFLNALVPKPASSLTYRIRRRKVTVHYNDFSVFFTLKLQELINEDYLTEYMLVF